MASIGGRIRVHRTQNTKFTHVTDDNLDTETHSSEDTVHQFSRFNSTHSSQHINSSSSANRLRDIMSKLDNPTTPPKPPPSEPDSDFDFPSGRPSPGDSLKSIFQRATRDPGDSPEIKRSQTGNDHRTRVLPRDMTDEEDTDRANLSDSSLPLSSAAASFKALAQSLEGDFEPADASGGRLPSLRAKGARNNQTLSSLLRNAEDMDDIESSTLSEREDIPAPHVVERQSRRTPDNGSPSPPPRRHSFRHQEPSMDGHSRSKRSSNFYSKDQRGQIKDETHISMALPTSPGRSSTPPTPARSSNSVLVTPPRRTQQRQQQILEFRTPSPPRGMSDLPLPPPSDEDEHSRQHSQPTSTTKRPNFSLAKTPKPPGGWAATPRAAKENEEPETPLNPPGNNTTFGKTPVFPGGWNGTPAHSKALKGILKNARPLTEDFFNVKNDSPSEASTSNVLANSRTNITHVDSFGRPLKFEEDGTEVAPLFGDASSATMKTSPSRQSRNASVRVVDSLGNEIQQQATMVEVTEELEESSFDVEGVDRTVIAQRMRRQITEMAKELEEVELKQSVRMVSTTNPNRLSQLAAEARLARIERERLKRKSHLVKEKHDEIATKLDKFKRGAFSPYELLIQSTSATGVWKWVLLSLMLLQILVAVIIFRLAHAYVRTYFLTIHYDPFIGAFPDPVRAGNVPFPSISVVPASWARFTPAADVSRWTRTFGTTFSSAAYHSSYAGRALRVLNSTRVVEWEWVAKWRAMLPTAFIQDVQEGARVWPPS